MKLQEALGKLKLFLREHSIENPMLESTIIASYALKRDDCFVISNPDFTIEEAIFKKMLEMAQKRASRVPLAYIIHKKEFMGLDFYVNKDVLIPRPETELVVQEALFFIKKYNFKKIIDLCTGSGAIAISIEHFSKIGVVGCDISYKALKVANINKKIHKSNVNFVNANLLDAFKGSFDIIVSNPPYILPSEFDILPGEVKKEPSIALLCDENYSLLKTIVRQSSQMSKFLIMEISPAVKNFIEQFNELFYIKQDYAGLDRIAVFKF